MIYKFTVLYPVHDGVEIKKIIKSIKSIIFNSLTPNEILIMIDGKISVEKELFFETIKKKFTYIKIIKNKKIGLSKILNKGLSLAKYEIIFRADSDDYSAKDRFKKQIDYFIKKKLDIMGCFLVENYGTKKFTRKTPKHPNFLLSTIINPINHMTVVFKKNSIIKLNGYPDIEYKEDIALWIKSVVHGLKIENMEKALVTTDVDEKQYQKRKNYVSIKSEFKLFLFIVRLKPHYLIFSFLITMLRIIYLILPIEIFNFLQLKFFRK